MQRSSWHCNALHAQERHARHGASRLADAGTASEFNARTVDEPTSGARDRERRVDFRVPRHLQAVNLAGLPARHLNSIGPAQSALFDGRLQTAPTWKDIEWLVQETRLPVLLKGVLHADACHCSSTGAFARERMS